MKRIIISIITCLCLLLYVTAVSGVELHSCSKTGTSYFVLMPSSHDEENHSHTHAHAHSHDMQEPLHDESCCHTLVYVLQEDQSVSHEALSFWERQVLLSFAVPFVENEHTVLSPNAHTVFRVWDDPPDVRPVTSLFAPLRL